MSPMVPAQHPCLFECDSCGHEVTGYTKKDLIDEGWVWHKINVSRSFVMCDSCEATFAARRTTA